MNDIICPNCGKAFKVDDTGYADILKQVRDREFEQQLQERLSLAENDKRSAVSLAVEKIKAEMQSIAAQKELEIQNLKASLDSRSISQQLAITEAVSAAEKHRRWRNGCDLHPPHTPNGPAVPRRRRDECWCRF